MSWRKDARGPYIRMATGRKQYLLAPEWNLAESAYHLAGVNRYTGGSRITVAQHMVVGALMAERFYSDQPMLPARFMLHDLAEGTFGDMSSPLKSICPEYRRLITDAERTVEDWSGMTFLDDPLVKELDVRCWLTERLMVYRDAGPISDFDEDIEDIDLEPFPLTVTELEMFYGHWDPVAAERLYLAEFARHLPWMERRAA